MSARGPTYHLGEDFPSRLDEYMTRFKDDGYAFFADEFAHLDDYIAKARRSQTGERLRLTDKSKYLLELVAFKIYDDLNREAFNRAKHTLIVMPDCLSLHNPDCEKVETKFGTVCRRCMITCQAHQITELGRQYRAKTIFSKRKLSQQLQRYVDRMGDLGVIGVACIMMLAEGMRTAAEVGVPARGVLLSFSGCEHWNDTPCASEFSMAWLESILEEKRALQHQKTDA